ncbi:hypothetical protein [Streptomyces sp. NBC_01408]|uniref:hypothetical protein n=1 Tax=Streptomyces sp. NBC_01408 TaxID=2903855 RepID=UPI002252F883|nr:hypothetical protein [Streptomyces sp. NBC_01408]MCX4695615.1 hypothetical protein [Streptomyces sp. NBC_01408]
MIPATVGTFSARATFRRSILLVTVDYTRPDDDRAKARTGALEAAREASGRL